jgi:chitin disaccharide deacetylase
MGTDKPKRVIVNADDFGFSPLVTEGILRAHREGILTSTTIAANMPAAAAAAGRLGEAPGLGVGVHLNVCQGPALSPEGRAVLAGPDGIMSATATQLILGCIRHPSRLAAVAAECEAQIRWALDHGIRPTHLDSHRHVHGFTPVFRRVAGLARRYDIRFVRRPWERLPGRGWPACPAKQRRVRRLTNLFGACDVLWAGGLFVTCGTWGVAHTGLIDAAWLVRAASAAPGGVLEIMTHPGLTGDLEAATTRLRESRQAELAALCDPAVRKAFEANAIELTHYGKL